MGIIDLNETKFILEANLLLNSCKTILGIRWSKKRVKGKKEAHAWRRGLGLNLILKLDKDSVLFLI